MICRARTLPTPGIDSSSADTFILPMTLVGLAGVRPRRQRGAGVLEPVLDLGPLAPGGRGLAQRLGALLGGQGRQGQRVLAGQQGAGVRNLAAAGRGPRGRLADCKRTSVGRVAGRERRQPARAAAAPGRRAPVIGRPMTSRSAPSASACSGVATRAWSPGVGRRPAGRRGDQDDAGAHLGADGGDLLRRAHQRAGAGPDRERRRAGGRRPAAGPRARRGRGRRRPARSAR